MMCAEGGQVLQAVSYTNVLSRGSLQSVSLVCCLSFTEKTNHLHNMCNHSGLRNYFYTFPKNSSELDEDLKATPLSAFPICSRLALVPCQNY